MIVVGGERFIVQNKISLSLLLGKVFVSTKHLKMSILKVVRAELKVCFHLLFR